MSELKITEYQGTERMLGTAVLAGMVAAAMMGLVVMLVAAAVQRRGMLTPVYDVAALLDLGSLAGSRAAAEKGHQVYWQREPFVFGAGLHLLVGALLGVVFALIARTARLRGRLALAGGVLYGLVVMLVMTFLVLPGIAAVLGPHSGVTDMPRTVGAVTFVVAHAVFGLVLGYWVYRRPQDLEL